MTVVPEASQIYPEDYARLQQQLAAANAALAAATAPKPPKGPSRIGGVIKRAGRALWAAVASTDAVRAEKNLAVLIVMRLLISAGAADGTVKLVQLILNSAGVTK